MYAQLCKRLAENAPNFEPPDAKTTTFLRLLLNKCRDEFENRAKVSQQLENSSHVGGGGSGGGGSKSPNGGSTNNDVDQQLDARFLAKRKMLGNIKFIGELGKLGIVHDSILHRCCEQLLVGRKKQSIPEQAEALECLCHLMRTCGRILDTPKAKVLMDQYFDRLKAANENEALPLRIRFLIQDILDMRRNKWMPRKLGKMPEGPRTIQQVREDAYRDGCIYMPQQQSPPQQSSMRAGLPSIINPLEGSFFDSKPHNNKAASGMANLFSPSGYGGYFNSGPGTIPTDTFEAREAQQQSLDPHSQSNGYYGRKENDNNGSSNNSLPPRPNSNTDRGNDIGFQQQPQHRGERGHGHHHPRDKHPPDFGDRYSANRTKDRERRQQHQPFNNRDDRRFNNEDNNRRFSNDNRYKNQSGNRNNDTSPIMQQGPNSLPPRFKKMSMNHQPAHHHQGGGPPHHGHSVGPGAPQLAKDLEVSLRPQAASSMLFKPKTPSMLPKSAISKNGDGGSPLGENSLIGPPVPNPVIMMQQAKESAITIKQGSIDKRDKNKGNKGPTRDEVFSRIESISSDLLQTQSTNEALEAWKENNWLPSKMNQTAVTHFFKLMVAKNEQERELLQQLLSQLIKDGAINSTHCQEAFNKTLSQLSELEKSGGSEIRSNMADAACWSLNEKILTLKELSEIVQGGQYYPIFLLALQQMMKAQGSTELKQLYDAINPPIKMADFVPENSRSDEALAEILETYELSFLQPLLAVQRELTKQFKADPTPTTFHHWISENIESQYWTQSEFILLLFNIVMKHMVDTITFANNADPNVQPDKAINEAEKELLAKYRPVLQPFVRNSPQLQLAAVYALQTFCFEQSFPKGLLLRSFVNFYELDIMEEQAYLKWKEDVNDSFPGKGKALFQVNNWLTWLEEAESEEEEDDEDEDDE